MIVSDWVTEVGTPAAVSQCRAEHSSYGKNKCAVVSLLITSLQSAGYTVHQAPDDADTLVVKVALHLATIFCNFDYFSREFAAVSRVF